MELDGQLGMTMGWPGDRSTAMSKERIAVVRSFVYSLSAVLLNAGPSPPAA